MRYVFDASSIVNLIKRGRTKIFAEGITLDLALYESINAIWKECVLLKRIDIDTAQKFVEIINKVFKVIKLVSITGLEEEVFTLALKESITVYDASYMYVAMRDNLILVTDDQKLRSKASRYVKAIPSSEVICLG